MTEEQIKKLIPDVEEFEWKGGVFKKTYRVEQQTENLRKMVKLMDKIYRARDRFISLGALTDRIIEGKEFIEQITGIPYNDIEQ